MTIDFVKHQTSNIKQQISNLKSQIFSLLSGIVFMSFPSKKDMAKERTQKKSIRKTNDSKSLNNQNEENILNLPDVSDIPGQEKIKSTPVPEAMGNTTVSSDDEEGIRNGRDILNKDDEDLDIVMGTEADVTAEDLKVLGRVDQDLDEGDDEMLRQEGLDDIDNEGEPLNEDVADIGSSGKDLDVPTDDKDDDDEENEFYSRNKNED
jgi:hypothetical protein